MVNLLPTRRTAGLDNGPADTGLPRGYSSAGRAVALQAIGQGFESPYLHISLAKYVRRSLLEFQTTGRSRAVTSDDARYQR
jgi:hypothetical protein